MVRRQFIRHPSETKATGTQRTKRASPIDRYKSTPPKPVYDPNTSTGARNLLLDARKALDNKTSKQLTIENVATGNTWLEQRRANQAKQAIKDWQDGKISVFHALEVVNYYNSLGGATTSEQLAYGEVLNKVGDWKSGNADVFNVLAAVNKLLYPGHYWHQLGSGQFGNTETISPPKTTAKKTTPKKTTKKRKTSSRKVRSTRAGIKVYTE